MSDRPIVVFGGTRGTGLLIVRLLDRQGVLVRVLARNPARALAALGPTIEVVPGDLTKPETISPAVSNAAHIIFTAGARSGYPVTEATVEATEYHGVLNTLAAARKEGFTGRFLYMTSSGVTRKSLATILLNLYKGNTLAWRRRAEDAIRASGVRYTIIRAGFLLNRPGGQHGIEVTQRALPLTLRYRIARADVAEVFAAALRHPRTERTTFEVVWSHGGERRPLSAMLDGLEADPTG